MHLLAICLSSLKKSLFSPLQHVFIGSIIFPEMSFRSCLYIFEINSLLVDSVRLLSHIRLFVTPRMAALQSSLSITNTRSSLKLTSIESVMPSSHRILSRPLLLLTPIPPSIRVLSSDPTLRMRWPKYWSFSFSIIPSKEHPRLISCSMDCLDLLGSRVFSNTTVQKHQLFHSQLSSQSNSNIHT